MRRPTPTPDSTLPPVVMWGALTVVVEAAFLAFVWLVDASESFVPVALAVPLVIGAVVVARSSRARPGR